MKAIRIFGVFIVLFLLTIVFIDRYNKFDEEKSKLKENLDNLVHNGQILKREYDRELRERLRLKNRYDLTKRGIEALQTELVRQEILKGDLDRKTREREALMAEVKGLAKENRRLKDETSKLQNATEELENLTRELEDAKKEKEELEKKNLELEKKFKTLEWINPED